MNRARCPPQQLFVLDDGSTIIIEFGLVKQITDTRTNHEAFKSIIYMALTFNQKVL